MYSYRAFSRIREELDAPLLWAAKVQKIFDTRTMYVKKIFDILQKRCQKKEITIVI